MLSAIIVEDEKPAARRLKRMLEKLNFRVITSIHTVEEAISWFRDQEHPDIIFLDIQLSDGLSFDIFEEVEVQTPVIFTTAYDEYALRAFKLNSIDYLLKPIDEEELEKAVNKFSRQRSGSPAIALHNLRELLQPSAPTYKKRFTISVGQHLKIFEVHEISCFFSQNKGTYLHCLQGRRYLMDCSLDKLEPELDPEIFFRINRQFIIRMQDISDIMTYSNQRLEVKLQHYSGERLIVSRERAKDFKEWLD